MTRHEFKLEEAKPGNYDSQSAADYKEEFQAKQEEMKKINYARRAATEAFLSLPSLSMWPGLAALSVDVTLGFQEVSTRGK